VANALYTLARQSYLNGQFNMATDNIKLVICTSAYTPNIATDQFFSSVSGVVATSANLTTKTTTGGVFDADDVTFTAVATGSTVTQMVLYQDTGVAGTSRLIALFDTVTGLPIPTNGGDLLVSWSNGASKIFSL
jgi:Cu2+-containing amine oxidase